MRPAPPSTIRRNNLVTRPMKIPAVRHATKASTVKKRRAGFSDPAVDAVFAAYSKPLKARLLALRRLILDTAKKTEGVGELQETLKWGQPSYLTTATKSGSAIRIDRVKASADQYALYFHCQTGLVATFRELYPI
jgi:hypothetical protein